MSVDVLVEPFYEWVVDASQVKGVRPPISGVTFVDDPMPYIERKLLTVNTGHSAIAYLGYGRGLATIHAALGDPDVRDGATRALEETGLLLTHEHGFDPDELKSYRQRVVARFENPRISDEVTLSDCIPPMEIIAAVNQADHPLFGAELRLADPVLSRRHRAGRRRALSDHGPAGIGKIHGAA